MVYYSLMTDQPEIEKTNSMFSQMIQRIHNNHTPVKLERIDANTLTIPTGYFFNEAYGTLRIVKKDGHYESYLGNNLQSAAFEGEASNEFRAEFVPGSVERFFVEGEGEQMKIRYDDFGYFLPKSH